MLFFALGYYAHAREENKRPFTLQGSLQSDILFPQKDTTIIPSEQYEKLYDKFALTNTYLDLNLYSRHVNAGARFEFLQHPLPGYETDFAGWGIPFFYAAGIFKKAKLTIGDFYDQFGNGLVFRTCEDRSLGIDNSLRGVHLLFEPFKGIQFKAIGGQQRRYWAHNNSLIVGGDVEMNVDQWISRLDKSNTLLMLGGSLVGKHESATDYITDPTYRYYLNLPENVGAYNVRIRLQKGFVTFIGEYAEKVNDPSRDNKYIYKKGNALLLSGSIAKSGISALLQAKRSDNMSFRSKRAEDAILPSFINRLPAFTIQQTYLLACLYPYATQPDGEWAFQGTFAYTCKRNTLLGGKYGTMLKLSASHIRDIDKQYFMDDYDPKNENTFFLLRGTDGYDSSFFKLGKKLYYRDMNLSIEKKISRDFQLNLTYLNQYIDLGVVKEKADIGVVKTNIFVVESKYQFAKKITLRSEIQYLNTRQDEGDWIAGVADLSVLPSLMFTVSDMYNIGETGIHYYKVLVTYTFHAHYMQLGYGRTRAGRDCSGGVCRDVPASKGFTLSYNYNF